MSESYDTGEKPDDQGELDVEENREDEDGGGYGASEQGDAGVEGPGDQSGLADIEEEDEGGAK